jgi:predicted PurR-regulated permease PerM
MTFWSWTRRSVGAWGFAGFIVLVAVLGRRVLLPFLIAGLLAYVLAPAVERLARVRIVGRPLPRFMAVILVYLVLLTGLGLFVGLFLPRLSADVSRLLKEAPPFFARVRTDYTPRAQAWLDRNFPGDDQGGDGAGPRPERKLEVRQSGPGRFEVSFEGLELELVGEGKNRYVLGPRRDAEHPRQLEDLLAQVTRASESEAMGLLRFGQRLIAAIIQLIASFVLVLMVSAFFLVDADGVRAFLRGLVPPAYRSEWDLVAAEIDRGLAGVVRGQFTICAINALLTYLGLFLLKVKYGLLLAGLAGVMSLIPVFGSILSSIPIVLVALVGEGHGLQLRLGLAVLGWIIGIHLLEANLLNPKIIGSAARIHPLVVIFALLVGETSGGLVGALVAVPIASVVQTLFLWLRRRAEGPSVAAVDGNGEPAPVAVEAPARVGGSSAGIDIAS